MEKKERILELVPAKTNDLDFAYAAWSESVKPHVGPYIADHLDRFWEDGFEKARFSQWWTPSTEFIITLDKISVGWMAYEISDSTVMLTNFVILSQFRELGIASKILEEKLKEWSKAKMKVVHSVLKQSGYSSFFERMEFKIVGEDELVVFMEKVTV